MFVFLISSLKIEKKSLAYMVKLLLPKLSSKSLKVVLKISFMCFRIIFGTNSVGNLFMKDKLYYCCIIKYFLFWY